MENDRVKLDAVPTGNNVPEPSEFPLPSLRQFLTPNQLVFVKTFEAASLNDLDRQVNEWVRTTASIITVPSQPTKRDETTYLLSMTYIQSNCGA